jgi:hypothetical protein
MLLSIPRTRVPKTGSVSVDVDGRIAGCGEKFYSEWSGYSSMIFSTGSVMMRIRNCLVVWIILDDIL